ncbi:hypothetical protein PG993_013588 [Apiospora rasikravindrae]|uniref:Uncharacterized protein n=1 Tax=Apiospora rasikravindrae TaxID=990691 RepID=A0ABR1RZL9_9PEZI
MSAIGCFLDTADEATRGKITRDEFLGCCLQHFGPDGVMHEEDTDPVAIAQKCFAKGRWGWLAAAFALCLTDPVAKSIKVEDIMPIFLAVAGDLSSAPQDSCTLTTQEMVNQPRFARMVQSALFLQALVVMAIFCQQCATAVTLLKEGSAATPPLLPPRDRNLFLMKGSPLSNNTEKVSLVVWAGLIRSKWAGPPSRAMVTAAASSKDAETGIAFFEAAQAAKTDVATDATNRLTLPALALKKSESPALFQYLCDMLSVPATVTNDMFVLALEDRASGGVEMLRWMLDEKKLDVNYVQDFGYPEAEAAKMPSRDRAEWEMSLSNCEYERRATALHVAAMYGNVEAVRFLLSRGASADMLTGPGPRHRSLLGEGGILRSSGCSNSMSLHYDGNKKDLR